MPRVINFEGTQHTFPDDATDQEIAAALGGGAPPAPPRTFGQRANDFAQGMGEGAFSLPQHAVELGARATDAIGLTDHVFDKVKGATDEANNRELNAQKVNQDSGAFKTGHVTGQVTASLPLAAVAPFGEGVAAAAGNGAIQGAAGGVLAGDPQKPLANAAIGAGTGGVLGGLTEGAANLLTPVIRPAVQALAAHGVTMSPGQVLGGWLKGLEDRLAGFPLIGDPIKSVQRESLRDFGNGAGNIAMGNIGPIPRGISGQAMSTTAHQLFDDAYGQVLPQLNVTLDPTFGQTVNNVGQRVAARLPDSYTGQFNGTLADVFKKMGVGNDGPANTFSGQAAKEAYSDLGSEARSYSTPTANPNDRALGRAYGDVQEGLRQSFANSDPWAASALGHIDTAYRNFIPVDSAIGKATGNAGGTEAGVFTPQQLRQAVVGQDRSARRVATAQGGGPLQQYAENGIEVLPSSVPDSGTAGRLGLLELINRPHLALPAIATNALYSRPVVNMVNRTFANGQGATGLAALFRDLGGASAPTAAAFTGARK